MQIQIIFYSMYGHIWRMAQAVEEGARSVDGAEVKLYQVPELIPEEALIRTGAKAAREQFAHVPVATPDVMTQADAVIFGVPTRYGTAPAQIRNFLDQTGQLWAKGAFIGKIGSVFTSTATQHGGQETTIMSMYTNLIHFGMLVVGVPYSCTNLFSIDEVSGGSPYGAGTITGGDGKRMPSENELAIARFQGKHVAELALKLSR